MTEQGNHNNATRLASLHSIQVDVVESLGVDLPVQTDLLFVEVKGGLFWVGNVPAIQEHSHRDLLLKHLQLEYTGHLVEDVRDFLPGLVSLQNWVG